MAKSVGQCNVVVRAGWSAADLLRFENQGGDEMASEGFYIAAWLNERGTDNPAEILIPPEFILARNEIIANRVLLKKVPEKHIDSDRLVVRCCPF